MFIFAALFNQITFTAMAKPKFQLRAPAATTPTLILLVYRFGDNKLVYSTGQSIHPDQWDKATQRAKTNLKGDKAQLAANKETNIQLDRYQLKITEILGALTTAKQQPTIDYLKDDLDREFKENYKPKTTLFAWVENWIETTKLTREREPKPISPKTKTKYRITLKHMRDFANLKRKGKLTFKDINLDFYGDFVEYLSRELNHTPNTIGKNIKVVKIFMREAFEAGVTANVEVEKRKFASMSEEVEHVYLTNDELDLIYNLDLSHKPALDRTRDLFIIGCYTALRFSDFSNIKPENIQYSHEGKFLKVKTFKASKEVAIPLHYRVEAILAKYGNILPRAISNQKTNIYIKEIARLAGINSPVMVDKTRGGQPYKATRPKYEMISSHTARRSGATNMFKAKIPAINIMMITGHKTESVFLRYINISQEENAKMLMQHDYFKPQMKVV
jgi:site-specific recombinase XerD